MKIAEKGKGQQKEMMVWKRKIPVAIIVLLLVIGSLFSVWYFILRPISVDELASRAFEPGDTVEIEGKIAGIRMLNTSYGKITLIKLEGSRIASESYEIIGENSKKYHTGDTFKTTLHFKEYRFNGVRLVTAPELFGTLMKLPSALQTATDASSGLGGFLLVPESYEYPTYTYRVFTPSSDEYPLEALNMTLTKLSLNTSKAYDQRTFPALFADEYLNIGSAPENIAGKIIDYAPSLEGPSTNGTVVFIDRNSNGMLDDGDEFSLNLPPTRDESYIDTYLLSIKAPSSEHAFCGGMKYIINWYRGPYYEKTGTFLSMKYMNQNTGNGWTESEIQVGDFSFPRELKFGDFYGILSVEEKNGYCDYMKLNLNETEMYDKNLNLSLKYVDSNNNGLLDRGDLFVINGSTYWKYTLDIGTWKTGIYGTWISWCSGIGHISGCMPDIEWVKEGIKNSTKYTAHPDYLFSPMTLSNASLRIVLENGEQIDAQVADGTIYSDDDVNITFTDANSDYMLSDGDYFTVSGDAKEITLFLACASYKILSRYT